MRIGVSAFCVIITMAGCSMSNPPVELNDGQINYLATNRCLYMEGVLSREQLQNRIQRDAKYNNPEGWMNPIVGTMSSGLAKEQNQRVLGAIEEVDCHNRILAWILTELPEDEGTALIMQLMQKWQEDESASRDT